MWDCGTGSTDRPPSVGSRKCSLEKGAALPEEPGAGSRHLLSPEGESVRRRLEGRGMWPDGEGLEHSGRSDLGFPGQAGRPRSGWPLCPGDRGRVRPAEAGGGHRPGHLAVQRASLTFRGGKCRGKNTALFHDAPPRGSLTYAL